MHLKNILSHSVMTNPVGCPLPYKVWWYHIQCYKLLKGNVMQHIKSVGLLSQFWAFSQL